MGKSFLRLTFYCLMIITLSGCATMRFGDLFSSYAKQMQPVHNAQSKGDFKKAQSLITQRSRSDGTYALSQLEFGRLQYLANNWQTSEQSFANVYQQIQFADEQAKIQISRGLDNVKAVVSNDNAIRYDIPLYEQSMLHSYQALNYLYQQDLSAALVEIRRANLVQEKALVKNQQSIYQAEQKMAKKGISKSTLKAKYPSMATTIGELKNGFQNAYTFYLSGLLYEAAGEFNDAYIDYKKALEIFPDNHFLQQDILRLASQLGMNEDLKGFEQQFGQYEAEQGGGQLVILFEQGIVNHKEEIAINLPIFTSHNDMRFYSVALPTYRQSSSRQIDLSLTVGGKTVQSQEIVRLQSLAAKQLQDQLPAIVTRQILRLIAKEEMREQMARKGGDVGNVLASLYNIVSEKADTRSWSTLPDNVQILRLNLSEGKHQLKLNVGGQMKQLDVEINPGRISLVNVNAMGNYLGYQTINL